jgi:hypothetical protein
MTAATARRTSVRVEKAADTAGPAGRIRNATPRRKPTFVIAPGPTSHDHVGGFAINAVFSARFSELGPNSVARTRAKQNETIRILK